MKYTYYPGCSLHSTAVEYDQATKTVFQALGAQLEEVSDWSCCGASSGHATSEFLALALPMRNLIHAEKQNNDVIVPCAACYNLLKAAEYKTVTGDEEAKHVNQELKNVVGSAFEGRIKVRHILEILSQKAVLKQIAEKIQKPLTGLKVVPYYGCLLMRPKYVAFEEVPEQPRSMDQVLANLGASVVKWSYKTDCCGASFGVSKSDLMVPLVRKLLQAARHAGADAVVCACPLCMSNLDTRQNEVWAGESGAKPIPVFYITELIGLALGGPGAETWLKKHLVDPVPLLKATNLL